jgi:hypothetical protein
MIDQNQYYRDRAHPYNLITDWVGLPMSLIGASLSSLVLISILNQKWRRLNLDLKLICLTLVCDIVTGIVSCINILLNLAIQSRNLDNKAMCNLDAIVNLLVFVSSINCVGVVSLERCLLVVYNKKLKDWFYWAMLGFMLLINIASWVVCLELNGFGLVPTTVYCLFDVQSPGGRIGNLLILISLIISMLFVYVGYIQIIFKTRRENRLLMDNIGLELDSCRTVQKSTITKSIIIVAASTMTNTPYVILLTMSLISPNLLTNTIDSICTCCIMMNQVLNCLIVINMRPDLVHTIKKQLKIKSIRQSVIPLSSKSVDELENSLPPSSASSMYKH